jgi:hypothetical protein
MINEAHTAFKAASNKGTPSIWLLFSHPEFRQDVSHDGLPIVSSAPFSQQIHDQINKQWDFSTNAEYLRKKPPYSIINDGLVLNYLSKAMKLTRRNILQQQDWSDWQNVEYLQLNQYEDQWMFGQPVAVNEDDAIFHLVWTYSVKAVDGRKKACCICDGSTRSGQVRVLAETHANALIRLALACSMQLPPQRADLWS